MIDKKTIAICSSVSFYKDLFEIENNLKKMGYRTVIPITAKRMRKKGDFDAEKFKSWFKNEKDFKIKKRLMDGYFRKILKSDAVLVVNNEKKGVKGYIGGNVLMEMAVAYVQKLPIYLWNDVGSKSPFEEEIKAMGCVVLNQDPSKISLRSR